MSETSTVFLVDDDQGVLRSVSRLLRAAGIRVADYDSPRQFLEQHDPARPGCLVLDYFMPQLSGLEVQSALMQRGCARPIVFLTGQADVPTTVRAMKSGAIDFLTKPVEEGALLEAVRRALSLDAQDREARDSLADAERRLASLTPREREVMELVVQGLLNKQVAQELGTVEKTVKVHRARVMEKMGAASLADLVRTASALGIGEAPRTPPQRGV